MYTYFVLPQLSFKHTHTLKRPNILDVICNRLLCLSHTIVNILLKTTAVVLVVSTYSHLIVNYLCSFLVVIHHSNQNISTVDILPKKRNSNPNSDSGYSTFMFKSVQKWEMHQMRSPSPYPLRNRT